MGISRFTVAKAWYFMQTQPLVPDPGVRKLTFSRLTSQWVFSGKLLFTKPRNSSSICYLVGGIPTPVQNMSSSVGMMNFPIWWESHKIPWFQSPPISQWAFLKSMGLSTSHSRWERHAKFLRISVANLRSPSAWPPMALCPLWTWPPARYPRPDLHPAPAGCWYLGISTWKGCHTMKNQGFSDKPRGKPVMFVAL